MRKVTVLPFIFRQSPEIPKNLSPISFAHIECSRRVAVALTCLFMSLGLGGCDVWPPSLHAEIEELKLKVVDATEQLYQLNNDNKQLRELQASLQQEIDKKEQENAELREQLAVHVTHTEQPTSEATTVIPAVRTPQRVIQKGTEAVLKVQQPPMTGPRVARIQRLLQDLGLLLHVDEVYGPDTAAAVREFQREHGLIADGILGLATERLLHRSTPSPALVRELWLQHPPLEGGDVIQLQRALHNAGHPLTIDGHFGPATDSAVTRFQKKHGLDPNGIVGLRTWRLLNARR